MAAQVTTADVTRSQVVELITDGPRRRRRPADAGRTIDPDLSGHHQLADPTEATDDRHDVSSRRRRRPARPSSPSPSLPETRPRLRRPGARRRRRLAAGHPRPRRAHRSSSPSLRPETFTNAFNFANLIHQSAAVIVIAMGLVFVLLLGEIDLSAGFTAGVRRGRHGHRPDPAGLAVVPSRCSPVWPPARSSASASACWSPGSASRRSS